MRFNLYFLLLTTVSVTLAETSLPFLNNLIRAVSSPNGINITRLVNSINLPNCIDRCMPNFSAAASSFFSEQPDDSKIQDVCGKVGDVQQCALELGCNASLMDAVTSAFKLICIDKIGSLSETIECIRASLPQLQQECTFGCGISAPAEMNSTFSELTAFDVSELCGSSVCLLQCARRTIEVRCNVFDNSIFDAIIDNVVEGNGRGTNRLLDWMLPEQCSAKVQSQLASAIEDSAARRLADRGNRPMSVGKPASRIIPENDTQFDLLSSNTSMTNLVVDGELRTLHCGLFDSYDKAVPTPDFGVIYKLLKDQFESGLPFDWHKLLNDAKVERLPSARSSSVVSAGRHHGSPGRMFVTFQSPATRRTVWKTCTCGEAEPSPSFCH